MADHYTTLGVTKDASQDDIKRAFRKLAHQHHPDKEGGDEEKFKDINAAYQILSDDQKRSQYDQFGQTFEDAGDTGPFGQGVHVDFENFDFGNVGDIFSQFFGGREGSTRPNGQGVGNDISIDLTISFRDSAEETTQSINHRIYQTCSRCHGNKAEPGTPITTCDTCRGRGAVATTRATPLGTFTQNSVCPTCQGEGKRARDVCTTCRGEGRELKNRQLEVTIPAGIKDGQTIRLSGKGEAPPGHGQSGDLYISVHVKSDPHLTRHGNDITAETTVSYLEAILGTTVKIPTLAEDKKSVSIPAGTQPGDVITLPKAGFPSLQGGPEGDYRLEIKVSIPTKLSRHHKKLLAELKQTQRTGLFR